MLKAIFEKYASVSGQVFDFNKSSLLLSSNMPRDTTQKLKKIFNLEVASHHENYLGLPSMLGRSKYQFVREIKEKIYSKLKIWKARLFSYGEREFLIKAIAQAITTYAISVFQLLQHSVMESRGWLQSFGEVFQKI